MRKEVIAQKDPKSPISELFRTIRTNIQFMNANKKMKTLLVTSTFPGEGKSWVASNLAVTFAQAGKRVVLIDADMRKGRQCEDVKSSWKCPAQKSGPGAYPVFSRSKCEGRTGRSLCIWWRKDTGEAS